MDFLAIGQVKINMTNSELSERLANLLQVERFKDYAPNGLQVEGRRTITKIVTAVTASQAAIETAIAQDADALLVHHGYFWKGEPAIITGIKKQRLQKLLRHDINLYAYHLPLDQHPEIGNNALLGQIFSPLKVWQSVEEPLIWHAKIIKQPLVSIVSLLEEKMARKPQIIKSQAVTDIEHIAWCTGAAQDFLSQAALEGAQVFISGEYAERTYHEANELNCHFIACGHHASEKAGICALGKWLAQTHGLETVFFDEENPF